MLPEALQGHNISTSCWTIDGERRPLTGGEDVSKQLIGLFAVLVFGFSFEPVRSVHLSCFVVSTVDVHAVRVEPW